MLVRSAGQYVAGSNSLLTVGQLQEAADLAQGLRFDAEGHLFGTK